MPQKLSTSILLALLFTGILVAKNWWEKKPYMEWSVAEVDRMLNESPWVAVSVRGLFRDQHPTDPYPDNWRIVLLTALPVREAYLRRLSFHDDVGAKPDFQTSVPVNAAKTRPEPEEAQYRLQRFMALYPDDIRVRGDEHQIVVGMSVTHYMPPVSPIGGGIERSSDVTGITAAGGGKTSVPTDLTRQPWVEDTSPGELMALQLPDLLRETFLSTQTGRRVEILRYDRPSLDMLGAKLYFSRTLPDGRPLITDKDRELRFETRINGKSIKAKFDLKKMRYKRKLEI